MNSRKRVLKFVARNHGLDPDEILIRLWEIDNIYFNYLRNENSVIKGKDYLRIIGLIKSKKKAKETSSRVEKDVPVVKVIYRKHDFSKIGRIPDHIEYLRVEEVIQIYNELVTDFENNLDPIVPSGIKDEKMLESAIFHPKTSLEGEYKYPTVETSAAAVMYALSHNHPFYNGNKRTAMVSMLVFLDRHNTSLECSEDDLFKESLTLANHKLVRADSLYPDAEIEELARWIHANSKIIKKGERPVTLKKLKQILDHFGATILPSGKIQRSVIRPSFFSPKKIDLISKRAIPPTIADGDEMDKNLIKSLREDLELTHAYGIDSDNFYRMAVLTPRDFIDKYKTLLKRLSKV